MATQQLLLRQLYVPLRVTVEVESERAADAMAFADMEKRRDSRRLREAGRAHGAPNEPDVEQGARLAVGERLGASKRLVMLGDPGGGKTTLLRWMATAYLLRYNGDPALAHLPDLETLPEQRWIPLLIRCRDLGPDEGILPSRAAGSQERSRCSER